MLFSPIWISDCQNRRHSREFGLSCELKQERTIGVSRWGGSTGHLAQRTSCLLYVGHFSALRWPALSLILHAHLPSLIPVTQKESHLATQDSLTMNSLKWSPASLNEMPPNCVGTHTQVCLCGFTHSLRNVCSERILKTVALPPPHNSLISPTLSPVKVFYWNATIHQKSGGDGLDLTPGTHFQLLQCVSPSFCEMCQ